jgi:uncharacterized membrane protein HdeD (DUF308 family)
VRGVLAILFGLMAILWPGVTLTVLILLFGVYVLVDGVLNVVGRFMVRERDDRWWVRLLQGVRGILVGLLTFVWPGTTALVLLYFIAAWELLTGVMEIITAIQLRRVIENEWRMILSGAASIIFGLILFLFPGAGALSLVWPIGAYAIGFGILRLLLAFRLRRMGDINATRSPRGATT